jgi:hypothetical protein
MKDLNPSNITSQYTGKTISPENLSRCAQRNGTDREPAVYIVYSCGFVYDARLREIFGVTDKLKDQWERRGTDFNVCLQIADGKIVSAQIDKYHESDGARPSVRSLKPTQQELRIAHRILSFIAGGD